MSAATAARGSGRLEGRKALVTGAGSGIGAASVRRLVAEGASVAALDIRPEAATATIREFAFSGDVTNTIDGVRGDHVMLAPPFIIDSGVVDAIVERLGDAIDAALDGIGATGAH